MTPENWTELQNAYNYLMSGTGATKLETPKWVIYKCGANIIRIDIRVKEK